MSHKHGVGLFMYGEIYVNLFHLYYSTKYTTTDNPIVGLVNEIHGDNTVGYRCVCIADGMPRLRRNSSSRRRLQRQSK